MRKTFLVALPGGRKIALAGMALAAIGVLAALGAWALAETAPAAGGNSITSPDTPGSGGHHTSLAPDPSAAPCVTRLLPPGCILTRVPGTAASRSDAHV